MVTIQLDCSYAKHVLSQGKYYCVEKKIFITEDHNCHDCDKFLDADEIKTRNYNELHTKRKTKIFK